MKKLHSHVTAKFYLVFFFTFHFSFFIHCNAQQNITKYIKVYFNQPVDNSFSNGVNAIYVHNAIMDTIAAYINRAKYTVDIAQYDYTVYTGDSLSHIATAVNNAYTRGVKIRWIYDGSSSNSGLPLLNSNIPTVGSPDGGSCYNNSSGIMHNKFMVVDEFDSLNAIVLTGSADWSSYMNDFDYNNILFIQSRVLARAYTNEFNIMWGDTTHGAAYNSTYSKFGICKPNSGTHLFHIGGSEIELYFSPSDTVNNHVVSAINSANTDMYCSMYDFTETIYSGPFKDRNNAGVYTSSVIDQYSYGYASYDTMAALPNFAEYTGSQIYHNKYLTVDPSNICSDPVVLTGSMNWTYGGYSENDENTIIIHNDTIANLYLQAHAKDYEVISGGHSLTHQHGCTTGINDLTGNPSDIDVFPNPFRGIATIRYTLSSEENITLEIYNIIGQKVYTIAEGEIQNAGEHTCQFRCASPGVYILKVQEGQQVFYKKLVEAE